MTRYLFASLLCALAFSAGAQSNAQSDAAAVDSGAQDTRAERDRPLSDRNCLRHTGSRIVATVNERADARGDASDKDRRKCAPNAGRSYDREDLERTGGTDVADALRKVDSSVN